MIGKHVVIDTLDNFKAKLDLIPSSAIVLIKDVGQIYAHGTYFGAQKTYSLLTKTADGLAPKGGTSASSLIKDGESEWVLTVTNGENPSWRRLPDNAFNSLHYTLPAATTTELGGIKVGQVYTATFDDLVGLYYKVNIDKNGLAYVHVPWINNPYTASGSGITLKDNVFSLSLNSVTKLDSAIGNKIYAVSLDKNGKLCVSVPWVDTNNIFVGATETKNGSSGMVPAPIANQHRYFLRGDGTWVKPNLSDLNDDVVNGKYLPKASPVYTGILSTKEPGLYQEAETLFFRNASNTADYGTQIVNNWNDGSSKTTRFVLDKTGVYFKDVKGSSKTIYHSGNFNPSDYLSKSGGKIKGVLKINGDDKYNTPLVIETPSMGDWGFIQFHNGAKVLGHIGVAGVDTPVFRSASGTNNTLIHSGNIGSQSVSYASSAGDANNLTKTWKEDPNYATTSNSVKIISNIKGTAGNYATGYSSGLSVISDYVGWQLMSDGGNVENPYFRSIQDNNVWKPWRKLAFIDDTVAAANKIGTYTVDNIYVKLRDFVGGKNILSTSLGGGGCTTATSGRDGTITWNVTTGKDAYFFIYTKEAIKEGEKLVLSFDVSGVNASNFASQWCWQNVDTRGKVIIKGNGRVYMYVVNSAAVGADGLILIDDWNSIGNTSGQSGPITFSNFKLERGEMGSDFSFNPIYVALKTDKAPDSDKLDGVDGASYARRAAANDFVVNSNEITMVPSLYSGELWLNHKTTTGADGNITKYNFGNGKGSTTGVTLQADSFTGNANTATVATYAKSLITSDNKAMVHFASNTLYVGDTIHTSYSTNILGKSIKLRYGTSATDGLILTENGRVGIGVASPSVKLEVDGSIKANTNILATDAYFSGNCFLKAGQEGIYVHGSGISWHNASNAWTKSIVNITSEGKVGIGVSPEKDFHVGGDFKTSGQSYFGTSTGCDLHLLRTNGYSYITAYKSLMFSVDGDSNNYALSLASTKNATFYGNVTAPSFIKSGSSDDYILLGGGGHTKIHGLVEYGLENLASGFSSGGQNSVANNIVTFTGGNSDTYFHISLTQTIDYTIPYTVGVYVENWSGTGSWSFGVGLLNNGNFVLTITKNGWNWATGYFTSGSNGASSFILDDTYRPTPAPTMKISKAVVVKGTSRAHYTPPLSKLSYYLPIGGGTLTGNLKLDTYITFNNTNLANWNVTRGTGDLRIMHIIDNSSTGNAPSAYCSGLSVMSKYTGFLLASYGGESNAFYFRSVSDGDKWLSWREVAFKDYVSSTYLPLTGGTLANTGTVLTIKLTDSTKIPYINFRSHDHTDLGDLGVNSSKNLVYYNSGGWKKIWHEGNLTPGNYLPASSYTASDVLTKLKTVDGSGSGLDADTVDGYHANSFVYSTGTYNLKPNAGCYRPQTTYIAIRLSNVNSVWTMMCMELLIREHYANPNYGKVILLVDKNNANALSGGLYYVLGKLSSSFKIYAAWDGTYFTVYLAGSWSYDSMSVQEVLFGDTAAGTSSKSISVTGVNSLPSSYVTLTMKNYYTVVGSADTDPNTIYYVT